jgi:hypothetical protein
MPDFLRSEELLVQSIMMQTSTTGSSALAAISRPHQDAGDRAASTAALRKRS